MTINGALSGTIGQGGMNAAGTYSVTGAQVVNAGEHVGIKVTAAGSLAATMVVGMTIELKLT
jgi:hypothetical protein